MTAVTSTFLLSMVKSITIILKSGLDSVIVVFQRSSAEQNSLQTESLFLKSFKCSNIFYCGMRYLSNVEEAGGAYGLSRLSESENIVADNVLLEPLQVNICKNNMSEKIILRGHRSGEEKLSIGLNTGRRVGFRRTKDSDRPKYESGVSERRGFETSQRRIWGRSLYCIF